MSPPRLLLLSDRSQLPDGRCLERTVAECASAGLAVMVLRELDLSEAARAALAVKLARHVTVISARTSLPATAGVHLAAHQPVVGSRHGRSCHDGSQLRQAVAQGAEWVTLSPVAPSPSKPGYGPVLGTAGVAGLVAEAAGTPSMHSAASMPPTPLTSGRPGHTAWPSWAP
ncbi:thiamine phosphate synthase [Nocardioides alcanivorans]|uniref:thiamine phosphate synthase n=1 Tax=Nocardioides alcanivorans TaxID=2897352 RepID=UPI001F39D5B1|nr:thiamine phosphate synthase [Nocardioides alcanivorans]